MTDVSSLNGSSDQSLSPAVSRAIRILDVLSSAIAGPLSLADLARSIDAPKSSTSNICIELEKSGMIRRETSGYVLGRRTIEIGGAYLAQFDQIQEFYRLCGEVPFLQQELAQIAVLYDRDVVYLARHEGRTPLRLSAGARVGDRYPAAITAVGRALLSQIPSRELNDLYSGVKLPAFTTRSTRTLTDLREKLKTTRNRGYALDQGEVFPNVVGIAMPIPPIQSGDIPLAINISRIVPTDPPIIDDGDLEKIITGLGEVVKLLSNPMALNSSKPRKSD